MHHGHSSTIVVALVYIWTLAVMLWSTLLPGVGPTKHSYNPQHGICAREAGIQVDSMPNACFSQKSTDWKTNLKP